MAEGFDPGTLPFFYEKVEIIKEHKILHREPAP
jgi:hypothetical protein